MTRNTPLAPSRDIFSAFIHEHRDALASRRAIATQDHDVIRRWAARHQAQPATGEATPSGPATIQVNDGGAGIRFNFPGTGAFRPISWDEWFDHFDRHHLIFVYEEDVADRAYELWQSRGGQHGNDRGDWFEAERQLQDSGAPAPGYMIVTRDG
jgi:hypothetical protein